MNTLLPPSNQGYVAFGTSETRKRRRSTSQSSQSSTSTSSSGDSDYATLETKKIDHIKQNWHPLALLRTAQKSMPGAKNRGRSPVREMDDCGNPKESGASFQKKMLTYFEKNAEAIGMNLASLKFQRRAKKKRASAKKPRREQALEVSAPEQVRTPARVSSIIAPALTTQAPIPHIDRPALTSSPVQETDLRTGANQILSSQMANHTPTSNSYTFNTSPATLNGGQFAYPTPQNSLGSASTPADEMLALMYQNPNFNNVLYLENFNWGNGDGSGIVPTVPTHQAPQLPAAPSHNSGRPNLMSRQSSTLTLNKQYRLRPSVPEIINTKPNPPQTIPIDKSESQALSTLTTRKAEFSEFPGPFRELRAKFKKFNLDFNTFLDSKALTKYKGQEKCTTIYSIYGRRYPTP